MRSLVGALFTTIVAGPSAVAGFGSPVAHVCTITGEDILIRQLQFDLEEDGARAPLSVSAEAQRSLVDLMAAAMVAVLSPDGGEHDEKADAERKD